MSRKRGPRSRERYEEHRVIDQGLKWFVAATWDITGRDTAGSIDRKAEADLCKAGFDVWRPRYWEKVVRQGRAADEEIPYFPGYLFVGTDAEPHAILKCEHVVRLLGNERPLAIPPKVMQAIADAFSGDVKSERMQACAAYIVGEMVSVVAGPFRSFLATIVELLSTGHIRGEVSVFGRATPVVFEPGMLERA